MLYILAFQSEKRFPPQESLERLRCGTDQSHLFFRKETLKGVFGLPAAVAAGMSVAVVTLLLLAIAASIISPKSWRLYIASFTIQAAFLLILLITWWTSVSTWQGMDGAFMGAIPIFAVELITGGCIINAAAKANRKEEKED